jgi:hypothetical protein
MRRHLVRVFQRPRRAQGRYNMICAGRLLGGLLACGVLAAFISVPAAAAPSPYPDAADYESVGGLKRFNVVNEYGVYFATPVGKRCAILDDGSYGCSGDIPGAQHGENEIGWSPGDSIAHLYRTDNPKFQKRPQQSIIVPKSFITYRGSTCSIDEEGSVYCINGDNADSQLLVTAFKTLGGSQGLQIS